MFQFVYVHLLQRKRQAVISSTLGETLDLRFLKNEFLPIVFWITS